VIVDFGRSFFGDAHLVQVLHSQRFGQVAAVDLKDEESIG
jgi:hypothetical protein